MIKREELTNPKSCLNRAADGEMTFVLLARDVAAPFAIRAWVSERVRSGKNRSDDDQILEAEHCAIYMDQQRADGIGLTGPQGPQTPPDLRIKNPNDEVRLLLRYKECHDAISRAITDKPCGCAMCMEATRIFYTPAELSRQQVAATTQKEQA